MDAKIYNKVRQLALLVSPWLILLALWQLIISASLVDRSLMPSPPEVATKFYDLLMNGRLLGDIMMSTQRVFLGVVGGIALAVPVGFLIGWYKDVRTFLDPVINFFVPCRQLP